VFKRYALLRVCEWTTQAEDVMPQHQLFELKSEFTFLKALNAINPWVQGLLSGETAAAAAGGVNVMLTPQTTARICLLQVCLIWSLNPKSETLIP
jgi:hypothetical protein